MSKNISGGLSLLSAGQKHSLWLSVNKLHTPVIASTVASWIHTLFVSSTAKISPGTIRLVVAFCNVSRSFL